MKVDEYHSTSIQHGLALFKITVNEKESFITN